MRLQVRALAIALAVAWGGLVFLAGLAHLVWPGYGAAFWQLVVSIYPGLGAAGLTAVLVETVYAVLDGAFCGALIAWIYNASSRQPPAS